MAITSIKVTLVSIKQTQDKLFLFKVKLVCMDEEIEVINVEECVRYRPEQKLGDVLNKIETKLQNIIDIFKKEQALLKGNAISTGIDLLNQNLTAANIV